MNRIWQQASAPALHARQGAGGLEVQPNAAAAAWAARHGIGAEDWRRMVADCLAAAESDAPDQRVGAHGARVGCHRVLLADGSVLFCLDLGPDSQDQRSRLVADTIGVGFWSRDIDAGKAYWDEQLYRIHRRAPEAGPPGFDEWIDLYVHPDDRGWVSELHRRSTAAWTPVVDATFRVTDEAGGERWLQTWTRRLWRDGRRLAFGMHLDVTERERDRLRAQRERERTRFALEAAEIGVWERALDGRLVYWDEQMYRLRGLAADDPRPLNTIATEITDPEHNLQLATAVQRHVQEGVPYRFEFRVRLPDGQWRWLLTQGRALRDSAGQVVGIAGINVDITERKEAEALRIEKARAEQANRDKSAFLARLSHELRTPMNAVLGFTQLLETDSAEPLTGRQRGRLRRIAEAGAHMMALVDDLLDLASLETSGPAAAADPLPLADVVQQAIDELAAEAARLSVRLGAPTLRTPLVLRTDRRRLLQAVSQVAAHALRRQRAGGVVEFAIAAEAGADGGQALVVVRDGGPAYGADERRSLFEPFGRGSAAGSGDGGTGIGLAIARRLVQSIGGTLDWRSGEGGASEFVLRLPLPHDPPAAEATPHDRRPLTVLCVEDNPVNLLLVRELLALRPQVRLHEAECGQAGIDAALAHRPDLLLLDLQLPDIDGVDVLRRLRAEPALASSTFIALSANAMPEQIAAARAIGFDDYWTKPIDFKQFLAGIDRVCDAQGASRSRSQPPSSAR